MKIRKNSISIFLCIAMLLSLVPASAASASEGKHSFAAKTVEVTVKAVNKEDGQEVPVEDALVTITQGDSVLVSASTDAKGVARLSLEGLSADELRNATVQACKTVTTEKGISATNKDALFQNYAQDGGDYYRYEYQLHSETIDADGNWLGKDLPFSTENRADIVFVIDGTGSMEDDLIHIKEEIAYFLEYIGKEDVDTRFSVIEFRDPFYGEMPFLHERDGSHWFTDAKTVLEEINAIEADGGGDTPYEGLVDAVKHPLLSDEMDFRNDALRFAFLFTDASTTPDYDGGTLYLDLDEDLAAKNIVTSVITAEELKDEPIYMDLREKTGGDYMGIDWPGICWNMFDVVMKPILAETVKMELMLSEPRMLYNISLCYLADDDTSRSAEYLNAIKNVMSVYSQTLAQTTDGHVYLNKVILFSTDSFMNFYDNANIASMADIRIETTKDSSVQILSNAYVNGFYNGETRETYPDCFYNLESVDDLKSTREFRRIQMSGKSYSWNFTFTKDPAQYAAAMTHESGHYIFGFYDEYKDQRGNDWDVSKEYEKSYSEYGLMDNEYDDIEMSKEYSDYNNAGSADTYHHAIYGEACEDVLADLLEKGKTDTDPANTQLAIDQLFESPYKATYTKADNGGADRRAEYPYAGLGDGSFILLDDQNTGAENAAGTPDAAGTQNILSSKGPSLPDPDFSDGSNYGMYIKKAGESDYIEIDFTENEDGAVDAELPVEEGEMAELLIAMNNGGSVSYETYFVTVTEPATGYLYSSPDNKVLAYATTDEETNYNFIAQNTFYENEEFTSLNQALEIYTNGPEITGGEIYSVASCTEDVDFTSISWFKFDGTNWTALPTDFVMEENYNVGARADLDGAGLYVLMGKKAAEGSAETPDFLIWEASKTRDAVVKMSFDDLNDNTKFYYVYYTDVTGEEDEDDSDEDLDLENAFLNVYPQALCSRGTDTERALTLNLPERGHMYRVSVVSVLEDGSRSAVSSTVVRAGEADRDGDGIPDWFMNQYHLWPQDETDISGNDMDGDGLTNLEEYLGGTDPIVPDVVKSGNALR